MSQGEIKATLSDDDETDVDIEFTFSGGSPGCAPSLSCPGDPPEAPEVEITKVYRLGTTEEIKPTEEQLEKLYAFIYENYDFDADDYPEWDC